ncbi:hypothetical protein L083_2421 [Actinoplanes sp. N902-109]|nr:hypothetical protein L083_2421 [Actinoplanes sp. N902-109]
MMRLRPVHAASAETCDDEEAVTAIDVPPNAVSPSEPGF